MKKQLFVGIIIAIIALILIAIVCQTVIVAIEEKQYSKEELNILIAEAQNIKDNAHTMAESARALGWTDDSDLIQEIKAKWNKADEQQVSYIAMLNDLIAKEEEARQAEEQRWAAKAAEYPAATKIWRYMKAQGWNDYVCAGIMGNLMAEVGGQTLDIRYSLSSSGYYGMCQWNRAYSAVWGAGLDTQCDFLRDTIKYEFDTYGFKYQKGFNFNSFLNLTDARQAALAFAKAYERCGSSTYKIRQNNAIKAYNYFVN